VSWARRGPRGGRFLISLAAFVLLAAAPAAPVRTATETFTAGGKNIPVERFDAGAGGKHPAVLILHGSEGLHDFGAFYRHQARTLAAEGYVVFLVHYFDRTGTTRVEPGDIREADFDSWADTVRRAVLYAARQPGVDAQRIGLVGVSLGAYLALTAAAPGDLPVAAVVELFGGLPEKVRKDVRKLPPTLIVHGDADTVVPVQEAQALEELMKARRLAYEIEIYKGQDHVFKRAPFGPQARHARRLVTAFLAKHLQGEDLASRR
jgi:carboxymethylenebutenolidase